VANCCRLQVPGRLAAGACSRACSPDPRRRCGDAANRVWCWGAAAPAPCARGFHQSERIRGALAPIGLAFETLVRRGQRTADPTAAGAATRAPTCRVPFMHGWPGSHRAGRLRDHHRRTSRAVTRAARRRRGQSRLVLARRCERPRHVRREAACLRDRASSHRGRLEFPGLVSSSNGGVNLSSRSMIRSGSYVGMVISGGYGSKIPCCNWTARGSLRWQSADRRAARSPTRAPCTNHRYHSQKRCSSQFPTRSRACMPIGHLRNSLLHRRETYSG